MLFSPIQIVTVFHQGVFRVAIYPPMRGFSPNVSPSPKKDEEGRFEDLEAYFFDSYARSWIQEQALYSCRQYLRDKPDKRKARTSRTK